MNDHSEDSKRKSYLQPKLTVVGNVRLVTKSAGMIGPALDGMASGNTKTS